MPTVEERISDRLGRWLGRVDLLAGTGYSARVMPARAPTILVFDSGVGGLTVFREVAAVLRGARFVYAADDAGFPYGELDERALVARVGAVMDRLIASHRPDLVIIACNTASTIVLPALRARHAVPFVGTVPAIKPAATLTQTGHVAVLGTPGTVSREYTRALISTYAAGVKVTLVGATGLAALAEAHLRGETVDDASIAGEIAPCFAKAGGRRADVVVLACTHYPLLVEAYRRLAPWPVTWLDPAPAIARRAADLLGRWGREEAPHAGRMVLTGGGIATPALRQALAAEGLGTIIVEDMPLRRH